MKLHGTPQIHSLNNILLPLPAHHTDSTDKESPVAKTPTAQQESHQQLMTLAVQRQSYKLKTKDSVSEIKCKIAYI